MQIAYDAISFEFKISTTLIASMGYVTQTLLLQLLTMLLSGPNQVAKLQ